MKTIIDYSFYGVTPDGKIWSLPDYELTPRLSNKGYLRVRLSSDNGKQRELLVHRLVAMAYLPNPENLPEVNHKNLDKTDNRVENLEWCTHQENAIHYHNNKQLDITAMVC